jgi:hypothetical protein
MTAGLRTFRDSLVKASGPAYPRFWLGKISADTFLNHRALKFGKDTDPFGTWPYLQGSWYRVVQERLD